MPCKLCQKDTKLVKSHIIPEAFYSYVFPENEGIIVSKDEYSKRLPICVYDKTILCGNCEKMFQDWDDYGNQFFHHILSKPDSLIKKNTKILAYVFNNIDSKKLALFIISVLWRASVSQESFFENVKLGPFGDKIKSLLLNDSVDEINNFPIIISLFNFSDNRALHPPHRTRINAVNYYYLYFFNSEILIKVDSRPLVIYKQLILEPNKSLIVSIVDLPLIIQLLKQ
ncbi:hypothetical protein [Fluoribacter dumoffii]|uniref:HNH endonuclease 5 domain-containing protein n=1 Tax=Fluoribacter dumoffii TaxID=463 RepID=A0A377ITK1_9GAMM|nr:hypothetical protein [Fluoribacter dumoffii]KTC88889.1 hypothetical protein Ldum_3147 [Fluoribacter dumoffii NY 23]STO91403.1 Uncharacterised protein [Fluoribacter dumoffii]STO91526.1 Uncharacterised protein [Fluoribacter dumoffii]STO91767.1 Uncharacterised protein [Fluoribacter dumoffii]